jgi:methylmalonyl-CoA mutase N-terminal domain/subunit
LHTDAYDEALALPSEKAARLALRTQQVVAYETGVAHIADPLGGSWAVEAMTDEMERQAEEVFAHLDGLGRGSILEGVYEGIEQGWFQGEIGRSAYEAEVKVNAGRRIVVGVNAFTEGDDDRPPLLSIGAEVEDVQLKRLAETKQARNDESVAAALAEVTRAAAEPTTNLMPPILDAVRAYATVGEVIGAMEQVFGRYTESAQI